MKSSFRRVFLFLVVSFLFCLYPVMADVDYSSTEDWWFLLSYESFIQEKGFGGYIILGEDMEYLAGWLTPGTPEDFFLHLSKSQLASYEVLPIEAAEIYVSGLGDISSYQILKEYGQEHPYVVVISVLDKDGGFVLEDQSYLEAIGKLERVASSLGYDKEDIFALYAEQGISTEELIHRVQSGENPRDMVLEAIRSAFPKHSEYSNISVYALVIILSILMYLFIIKRNKM